MNNQQTIAALKTALGGNLVMTDAKAMSRYRQGFRSGGGEALAVVFPDSLVALWRVLQVCVKTDVIVIMQAANTGLTEGSTPAGNDYERPVVIVQTLKLNHFLWLAQTQQVVSFPGTTLFALEEALRPLGREPHSVIGSSCIGASVIGGIANNSGGALIKRGPAYTELALYARIDESGELELVNHLGIDLGLEPEQMLNNLQTQNFCSSALNTVNKQASDTHYESRVRDVNANTPARFNADHQGLYEASGCAGKLAIFAVLTDTFEQAKKSKTFYLGVRDPKLLTKLRREILTNFTHLPISAEYVHGNAFDIAHKYGKDSFLAIEKLGTARLPKLLAIKNKVSRFLERHAWLPNDLPDKFLYYCSKLLPEHLPKSLLKMREQYDHHLIINMADEGIVELSDYLARLLTSHKQGRYIECTPYEAKKAMLHRFVVAGAAIRYQQMNRDKVADILALDIALRRNQFDWAEELPASIASAVLEPIYYGHFFCHVFHRDYILKKGHKPELVKNQLLALLDSQGARYPAEHNVGHLYHAGEEQKAFFKKLDPTNSFNPGVGKMSKHKHYRCGC